MAKQALVVSLIAMQIATFEDLMKHADSKGVVSGEFARANYKNNVLGALVNRGALVEVGGEKKNYKSTGAELIERPIPTPRGPNARTLAKREAEQAGV